MINPSMKQSMPMSIVVSGAADVDCGSCMGQNAAHQDWMAFDHMASKAINANESTSLSALIAYVAFVSGQSEFRIEREFADRFSIPNPRCLPADLFDSAIRYLVEMAPAA